MTAAKHIREKLPYYSQFSLGSNKISLFILENLILSSDKKLILSFKILRRRFHQE